MEVISPPEDTLALWWQCTKLEKYPRVNIQFMDTHRGSEHLSQCCRSIKTRWFYMNLGIFPSWKARNTGITSNIRPAVVRRGIRLDIENSKL